MSTFIVPYITAGVCYGAIYRLFLRSYIVAKLKTSIPEELKAKIEAFDKLKPTFADEVAIAVVIIAAWPILMFFDVLSMVLRPFGGRRE